MIEFTKEIESQFERGTEYFVNGTKYIIRSFAKYYKVFENGTWKQYDVCLYLYSPDDIEKLRRDNGEPTELHLHWFNIEQ